MYDTCCFANNQENAIDVCKYLVENYSINIYDISRCYYACVHQYHHQLMADFLLSKFPELDKNIGFI